MLSTSSNPSKDERSPDSAPTDSDWSAKGDLASESELFLGTWSFVEQAVVPNLLLCWNSQEPITDAKLTLVIKIDGERLAELSLSPTTIENVFYYFIPHEAGEGCYFVSMCYLSEVLQSVARAYLIPADRVSERLTIYISRESNALKIGKSNKNNTMEFDSASSLDVEPRETLEIWARGYGKKASWKSDTSATPPPPVESEFSTTTTTTSPEQTSSTYQTSTSEPMATAPEKLDPWPSTIARGTAPSITLPLQTLRSSMMSQYTSVPGVYESSDPQQDQHSLDSVDDTTGMSEELSFNITVDSPTLSVWVPPTMMSRLEPGSMLIMSAEAHAEEGRFLISRDDWNSVPENLKPGFNMLADSVMRATTRSEDSKEPEIDDPEDYDILTAASFNPKINLPLTSSAFALTSRSILETAFSFDEHQVHFYRCIYSNFQSAAFDGDDDLDEDRDDEPEDSEENWFSPISASVQVAPLKIESLIANTEDNPEQTLEPESDESLNSNRVIFRLHTFVETIPVQAVHSAADQAFTIALE